MFLLEIEVQIRLLNCMSLAVCIYQVVHRVRFQVLLNEHMRVGEVFEKKQELTWVYICVLEPL